MTENTPKPVVATGLNYASPTVNVRMTDEATVQDVREAFQELAQQIQMKDTRLIDNGETIQGGVEPLRIRRFSEDLYIISGYSMPDPHKSPVSERLMRYQANPLAEAMMPGTYHAVVFQHGNRHEVGNTGVTMEALISICIDRLCSFQEGGYWCEENDRAIGHLEQALAALNERAERRVSEGRLDTQIPEVTHANLTVRPISKAALASHGNNEPFGLSVAGPRCYRIKPDRVWASTDVFNEALTEDDLERITADQYAPGDYLVENAVSSLALGEPFVVCLVQKIGLPPPSDQISEARHRIRPVTAAAIEALDCDVEPFDANFSDTARLYRIPVEVYMDWAVVNTGETPLPRDQLELISPVELSVGDYIVSQESLDAGVKIEVFEVMPKEPSPHAEAGENTNSEGEAC